MRVRTAVAIGVSVVAAKAALTWLALQAWAALPQRPAFVSHWRIQLGTVGEWFAAFATTAAVGVALYIAGRDRSERNAERRDEQRTHARLVQLSTHSESNRSASVVIEARNFGPLPVIDVDVVDATWSKHPDAHWVPRDSHWVGRGRPATNTHRPILKPSQGVEDTYDTLAYFVVMFHDPADPERPLGTVEPRTASYQVPSYIPLDMSEVVVHVRFTTADGIRWETPTKGLGSGEPTRVRAE
ncbi:hypothetical protein [Mycolicibacterium wolinskyi]|uniref:hypothetical protein n=1 Tax=Mycolicibacterium wolinskyi TaxID=59750 RepID=UPI003917A0EE